MPLRTTTAYAATDGTIHRRKAAALRQSVIHQSAKDVKDRQAQLKVEHMLHNALSYMLRPDVLPYLEELVKETKSTAAKE